MLKKIRHVEPKEDLKYETEITPVKKKTDRTIDMLSDFYNRFDVSSTKRAKDLGLSASASDKIYKELERDQLAEVCRNFR